LKVISHGYTIGQCKSNLAGLSKALNSLKFKKGFDKIQVNCKGYHYVLKSSISYSSVVVEAVRSIGFDVPGTFSLRD
jgi:hypothetical protein